VVSGAQEAVGTAGPRRFLRYPEYKDSGVEWLGVIPAHWEVMRLGFNAALIVPMRDKPVDLTGEIPWIRIEDFEGRYISGSKSGQGVSIGTIGEMNLKVFPVGTVLCSCSCNMGATAIVEKPLVSNQTFIGIVPRDNLASEYVYYLMQVAKEHLTVLATGAIQQYLSRNDFSSLRMPLLPSGEQRAIAVFLDRETARIDALLAKKERLIELLQEKRTALITRAVTKGLDPNVPMKDSGIEWLGEIPAHWEIKRLRHISSSLGVGVVVNPSHYVADEGLPFLYGSDISEGRVHAEQARRISPQDSRSLPKSQLRPGDLVMVRVGAPGVTAVVPAELDGANCASLLVIRRKPGFPASWLCYALNSRYVRSQVEAVQYGAAQEQFNVSHAVNFLVPVPRLPEQESIAAFLDRETARIDALVAKVRDAIDRLKEFRTALISAAVTGKIDVTEAA